MAISKDEMIQIAQMAARIVVEQIQEMQNAYLEMMNNTKQVIATYPELKGRQAELGDIVSRLATSSPGVPISQMLDAAAKELLNRAN